MLYKKMIPITSLIYIFKVVQYNKKYVKYKKPGAEATWS